MQKLPLCAYCGRTIARQTRVLFSFPDLPGNPTIGWHYECAHADKKIFELAVTEFCGNTATIDYNFLARSSITLKRRGPKITDSLVVVFKRDSRRLSVRKWGPQLETLFDQALMGPHR